MATGRNQRPNTTPSTPTTAANKPETKRAAPVAAMDYSALTASDVDASAIVGKRNSMLDKTPFVGWMRESRESGTGKQFSVPEAAAEQTERLLRLAARQVGCGAKIVASPAKDGQVTIAFKAKDKKATAAK